MTHRAEDTADQTIEAPVVSVVAAAYNAAPTLRRAVESAMAQTLPGVEIIIVDDGSSDETFEIAQELASHRPAVRALRLQRNSGPSAARNAALDVAGGQWIAVLDADDAFAPDRLAAVLSSPHAGESDFIADNLMLWAEDGNAPASLAYDRERLTRLSPLSLEKLLDAPARWGGDLSLGFLKPIMRRAFLNAHRLRYDETVRCAEDWLLYARALLRGARFTIIPDAYYFYTVDRESQSHSRSRMVENVSELIRAGALLDSDIRAAGGDHGRSLSLLTRRAYELRRLRRIQFLKKLVLDAPGVETLVDRIKHRRADSRSAIGR